MSLVTLPFIAIKHICDDLTRHSFQSSQVGFQFVLKKSNTIRKYNNVFLLLCFSANDASSVLQKRGVLHNMGVSFQDLVCDTQDNYRLFINLEKLLKDPPKLAEQHLYQLDPQTRKHLIERCTLPYKQHLFKSLDDCDIYIYEQLPCSRIYYTCNHIYIESILPDMLV